LTFLLLPRSQMVFSADLSTACAHMTRETQQQRHQQAP
jgi:hypothetical protein